MDLISVTYSFPGVARPDGVLIDLPNRDPRLPRLYQVKAHAQVKETWCAKRIFVFLQDTSAEATEDYYKFLSTMQFPEGTKAGIQKAGELP